MSSLNRRWWIVLVAFLALAGVRVWIQRPQATAVWAESLDGLLAGEPYREVPIEGNALAMLGVSRYRFIEVPTQGSIPVWLYAGYYSDQQDDAQIHAPEHCYPGTGYQVARSQSHSLANGAVRELVVERGAERRLVWYVYRTRVGSPITALGLKRDQVLSKILGRSRDAMIVRASTPVLRVETIELARARLSELWMAEGASILRWFDGRGGRGA